MLSSSFYREPVLRVVAVAVILALAQTLVVPVVISGLLTLALSPIADFLIRWSIKRWLANTTAILLCLGLVSTAGWLVADQLSAMAQTLPQYGGRILERTRALGPAGVLLRGAYGRFQRTVEAGTAKVSEAKETVEKTDSAPAGGPEPSIDTSGLLRTLRSIFLAIAGTVGNSIIILVLTGFFLAQRQDLGQRILLFFQEHGIPVDRSVLSDMSGRVSKYLLAEVTVNALYGGCVALLTGLEGLPHPLFWGVLVFLFRFIPYVGTWIVALVAFIFSLGVAPSWVRPITLVALWVFLELLTADVIEPLLYGRRTGLTSVGVLLSALFWGWIWGAVGLVLATPITASLAVFGRVVPSLRWVYLLTASEASPVVPSSVLRGNPPVDR